MTNAARRLPDFIIAGAAKSATTWLQRSLQASAQIFMPDHEPHFFSRHYQPDLAPYHALFDKAPLGAMLGEKSNSYLSEPDAEIRIHRHLPGVPLIFQLRDPVARAYSDYCMLFRRGAVDDNIARYLDPDLAAQERFLRDSCYADHLSRYSALWPEHKILILLYEDIQTEPVEQLRKLARHVGLQGTLATPLTERVKDARTAVVPAPLRRVLRPFRPVLDPLRHTRPLQMLRSMVARPYRYPELDPVLQSELRAFFQPQIDSLSRMKLASEVNLCVWSSPE